MLTLLAGLLAAGVIVLLGPRTTRLDVATGSSDVPKVATGRQDRSLLARARVPLCGLSVIAGWTVFGGLPGLVVGLVGAVLSWRALSRLESPEVIRRRLELERDLPAAVHLLGACLAAGSATSAALASVAAAMPGAVGDELTLVHRRLHWGVDPASVWRSVDGPMAPLGRSMARTLESGASVQQAIARLAEDLRTESRARADSRARTIEVRAAAPLGLCFLPAFLLLGVVPMAAGLFSSMALFR